MTTFDILRRLKATLFIGECACCKRFTKLQYDDLELGTVCAGCADELLWIDVAVNYDVPCGWARATRGDTR